MKQELTLLKRSNNDYESEISTLKQTLHTKELEIQTIHSEELGKQKSEVKEFEEKYRLQGLELKKLREDHIQIASKLASSLQLAQVSVAEADACKMEARSAVLDCQSAHHALTQSVQRLQSADAENIRLKAEILQLNQELQSYAHQVNKQQSSSSTLDTQLSQNEMEYKRYKSATQVIMHLL